MIRFADSLYYTEDVYSKISQIKWKTVCGIGMLSVYFITLTDNKKDLFDIYSSSVFKQRQLRKSNLVIIGIAGSYNEAIELTGRMINECLASGCKATELRTRFENYADISSYP